MDNFVIGNQFISYAALLEGKKDYEIASNCLLVRNDCRKLKGDGDFVNKFVYEYLVLECKAGAERPIKGFGLRKSSTIKRNCKVKIRLTLKENNFLVTFANLQHENHSTDKITFNQYPENVRMTAEESGIAKSMISCGANKQQIKMKLMSENGGRPIPLKALHNLQTKIHKEMESELDGDCELEKLLSKMQLIPNARIRIITNEEDELIGILFQDERMATLFEKFPELILFDATYKLNNRRMPLFTQLVIDSNGVSEIVSLYICKSESIVSVESMLDEFKLLNSSWTKTRVIMGDKDFADRYVYKVKFRGVFMRICKVHVLRTFKREITPANRNISKEESEKCLDILQAMVYSKSAEKYDELYKKLSDLNVEEVMDYFNTNWHTIREEWTAYGHDQAGSFMTHDNNRSESLNQKFKMIGVRYAGLLPFFGNISTSVGSMSSEKDITVIQSTMKTERRRFEDRFLSEYHKHLTPFIFKKLEKEYIKFEGVELHFIDDVTAIVANNENITVKIDSCSCAFFSGMNLPCRHIFQFLCQKGLDLFVPQLCLPRWTKNYYHESHPALNEVQKINPPLPTYVRKIRVREEMDKYREAAAIIKDINSLTATLPTDRYTYYVEKLKELRNEISVADDQPATVNMNENVDMMEENTSSKVGDDGNLTQTETMNITPENFIFSGSTSIHPQTAPNTVNEGREVIMNENVDMNEKNTAFNVGGGNGINSLTPIELMNIIPEHSVFSGSSRTYIQMQQVTNTTNDNFAVKKRVTPCNVVGGSGIINIPSEMFVCSGSSSNINPNRLSMNSQNGLYFGIENQNFRSLNVPSNNIIYIGPQTNIPENIAVIPSATDRIVHANDFFNSQALKHIRLPPKNVKVGRPKGEGKTVIGLKRKPKVAGLLKNAKHSLKGKASLRKTAIPSECRASLNSAEATMKINCPKNDTVKRSASKRKITKPKKLDV